MIKFDLGGLHKHEDYISVNLMGNPAIKTDITDLDSFCKDNSVDEFFMSHTFEHIPLLDIKTFLEKILRKLKIGGCFRIKHTDIKACLELYKEGKLDFKAIRNLIFTPINRRMIEYYYKTGKDLNAHKWMWGHEELIEELLFYGFSKCEKFEAGFWIFDFENYFPNDNMENFYNVKIPNLGVCAYK